ncbi:family 78 glycoside hydrolase catalytic domain [Aestuariimicrobium ganziense]|uniref:family 78 glycoside hydrolase catalytic domain n=1 Tax=Aestuariimicrobium ganziense TaxID=2773677 RepID=UPI001942B3CD|nr:family 78 glycoside hydrolase catalytic domain [Aestuariimicrobium ganziense]
MLPDTWRAAWITADPHPDHPHAAPIFRRAWPLDERPTNATLHLSAQGTVNATINGRPVSDARLGPGLSNHAVVARATTDDVTDLVAGADEIVLAADLGRGFYDMHTPEVWEWVNAPWRDTVRMTAELHLTFADGRTEVLVTDDSWRTSTGGTRFDSLYEGEDFDQTLEPAGGREPGFDDSSGTPAVVAGDHPMAGRTHQRLAREVATSGVPLREAMSEPIRVVETITPTWTKLADGHWIGDVGRVVAGWVEVTPLVEGRLEVEVRHGEALDDDGGLICENKFIRTGRFQHDRLVLDGQPWQARHTWKGFRYLEVTGVEVDTDVTVTACVATADVPVTSSFTSDNPTLTWLHQAFVHTVRANLHWVPTDTPTFEKNGWTGDAQVALAAMLARFDLRRHLGSWLDDFLDAQREDGQLPVIIPSAGWGYDTSPCSPAPEWTTLYPVMVDALVNEYELDLWPVHRDGVVAYLRHEIGRLDEDGLAYGILGDYLSPGTMGPPPEDVRIESSILLAHALSVTARALAGSPEADEFEAARGHLVDAINAAFLDRDKGVYSSVALTGVHAERSRSENSDQYRQTPQVLALAHRVVPDDVRSDVLANLVADIEARGDHHNIGCIGGEHFYSLLMCEGHADLALRAATNPTGPSWEVWRAGGHQTLLEMWVEPVRSRAHYFHGAGIRFIEDQLAGLRREAPGWRRFTVAPRPVAGVDSIDLVRAGIRVAWLQADGRLAVDVTVPEGSTATLVMPDGTALPLSAGEHHHEGSLAAAG